MKKLKIALDGPAASGKSTIAREVAKKISYLYIDTGAMYRAITWKALKLSANFNEEDSISEIATNNPVEIKPDPETPCGYRVFINNEDITAHLFDDEVNRYVSLVARISEVRRILVAKQKEIAKNGGVVMTGRDITTVVMPDAEIKIFLTASEEERIKRRYKDVTDKGEKMEISEIKENIRLRDKIDSSREDSPLCIAPDAIIIDSSAMSIEEVVEEVMRIVENYASNKVQANS